MSNLVFPTWILGELFTQRKTPNFNTGVNTAVTGKSSRLSRQAYPLYSWELGFELLRDDNPRTNFVVNSQDVTQWSTSIGGTGLLPVVSGNYSLAPDGTLTAGRVILNKGSGTTAGDNCASVIICTSMPANVLLTFSFWAKTNDGSTINVFLNGSALGGLVSITPIWTRFSKTFSPTVSATNVSLLLEGTIGTANYADLSVWGAQVELGALATSYIPTFGSPARVNDLKDIFSLFLQMAGQQDSFLYQDPDFNTVQLQQFVSGDGSTVTWPLTATYRPGVEIPQFGSVIGVAGAAELVQSINGAPKIYTARYGGPELVAAVSRQNIALQSNFAATWLSTNAAITLNAITAPDSTATAASLNDGAATAQHYVQQTIAITAGTRYTFSVWAKFSTRQFMVLGMDDSSTDGFYATFDLENGKISQTPQLAGSGAYCSAADAQITAFPNGWYRCSISGQIPAASANVFIGCSLTSTPGATIPSYTGDGGIFYIWGAQLELGLTPTALIPTTGSAATQPANYSRDALDNITFATAPPVGQAVLWSGSFHYRVRFDSDSIDFDEVLHQWWELKQLSFIQVKL